MAEVRIAAGQVSLHLNLAERVAALHGHLRFPRSAVRAVRVVDAPFREIQGIRCPGTRVPGILALGTWRRPGGRDFVAVYRGTRGIVVELAANQSKYQRIILTSNDLDGVRNLLTAAG